MTWMASQDGDDWQIIERGNGWLVQKLVWNPRRHTWVCGCGREACLHQQMLEALEVKPPRGRPGAVAPGATFDPFTQKGY